MRAAFAAAGLESDAWVSPVDAPGARLIDARRATP
jgi:homoserine kinase